MTRRILLPIVSIAAAALAISNLLLWQDLQAERQHADALTAQFAARRTIEASPKSPQREANPTPSTTPVESVAASTPPPPPLQEAHAAHLTREAQMAREAAMAQRQSRQDRLMADPRYREELRRQLRLGLNVYRNGAIGLAGMTEAEADAALDLWAERDSERRMRTMESANIEEMRARRLAEENRYEESLRQLLGDTKAAKWKHYRDSMPTRMRVTQLQTQLQGADLLREDQIEPLIEAMDVEQSQLRKALKEQNEAIMTGARAGNADLPDFQKREIELMMETKKRVLSAASPILSSAQLDRLDAMYEREIESRRSRLRITELQQKIMAPDPSGAPN